MLHWSIRVGVGSLFLINNEHQLCVNSIWIAQWTIFKIILSLSAMSLEIGYEKKPGTLFLHSLVNDGSIKK